MDQQPNFDFIMNPGKNRGMGSSAGKKQRVVTVVGGVAVLLIATLLIGSLLNRAANKSNDQVLDLVAYQSELKRIIEIGVDKARSSDTKNKATTASYTLESDYQQTVKIVSSRGIEVPKDLTSRYASAQIDKDLDAAEKANEFDQKYGEIYKEKLTNYKSKLSEIYPALSPSEQVIIKKSSDNAKLLLGEPLATPAASAGQ
jgi:hypothetical protein